MTPRTLSRSHFVFEYLLALPAGALLALVWANAAGDSYFRVSYAMSFIVNEVVLVFFFGWITKEIVEATAPGGLFHPLRRIWWPALAALSGALTALLLYRFAVDWLGTPRLVSGWPALFAIDLALGYFVARVIFGRHAAVTFFLLMAIISNGVGFIVLAITHPLRQMNLSAGALLMTLALTSVWMMRLRGVRSFWPYVVVGGPLSWAALYAAGFHAAFALVPILVFLPHARRDPGFFVDAARGARNALDQFERWCRVPAQVASFCSASSMSVFRCTEWIAVSGRCRSRCSPASRSVSWPSRQSRP